MYCHQCGKEIPDGAKFCNFCGEPMPQAPRHARPDPQPEELYSFSDPSMADADPYPLDYSDDRTRVFDPVRDEIDETKVYNFEAFEEHDPVREEYVAIDDDRERFDDSYENYLDGEDDDTFMDKLDNKFRRDDDYDDRRPPQRSSKTWLWITLGVFAAVLIVVFAILAFSGSLFGGKKNAAPTVKPTVAATVKATEKPKPTEAPKQTEKPKPTEAPKPTQASAPTQAPQPITEAPQPTDPPAPEPTESPVIPTEAPVDEPVDEPADTPEQ